MPNIYKINVSPKPLTNLTAVLTFTDDSTSTRTDWIEADTYYTITETTIKTLKSLTVSANNYITQTLETSDLDIDITLSPNIKYVSKIKNNGVVYTLKDESVDGKVEGLANKTLSNVSSIDNNSAVATALNGKQATLVSGTNIKTINNTSLLGSGNIDANNIFIAEYGVTSYSDIDTAYNAGKMLFVVDGDFYYPLMSADSSSYVFSSPDADGIYQVYISSDGTWSENKYGFPTKISDLTDDTSTYPISEADTLTGLTATISELNILDGATLSTTELNYVDGVTSSIQTQLNNKQDTLVSGTNIKTINNTSLLGSGNLSVGTVTSVNNTAPVNGDVTISIPTVNNATLTIQKNGTTVNTFTANASSDVTCNITVPTAVTDLSDASNYVTNTGLSTILDDYATEQWAQQQASSLYTSIQGWVNNQGYAVSADLADVATTGDYDDLLNKPTIPQAQIQSDWNQTDSSAVDFIKNKPTIPSGVIVDQVYDGTSTNAQSGVAIEGELANYVQLSDIDSTLSTTSENPVQNRAIYDFLNYKQDFLSNENAGENIKIIQNGNSVWTTPSEITELSSSYNNWQALCYGNNKYVALGYSGYISTSTDGITWTTATQNSDLGNNAWKKIVYGSKYVALGYRGYISTSSNGTSWSTARQTLNQYKYWQCIAYGGNKFVVISTDGYISTSTNGSDWSDLKYIDNLGGNDILWYDIIYNNRQNGFFIAIGYSSQFNSSGVYLSTSSDGINWSKPIIIKNISSIQNNIAFGNYKYIALSSSGNVTISKWNTYREWYPYCGYTELKSLNIGWNSLIFDGTDFIALNENGYISKFISNTSKLTISAIIPTVDQTFNSSSANAQSGIAIAGELTNYLQASNGNVTFGNDSTIGGITYEDSDTGEMYGTFIGYTPFGNGVMMGAVDPNGYLLGVTSSGINIFKGTTAHPTNGIALTVTNNNTLAINGTEVALSTDIPTNISDLTDDTATNPVDKADTLTGLTATITELNYTDGVTSNIQTQFDTITGKIPSQASTSNQLADKAFVNSSVQTATANFRGNWDTWTLVPTSASSYPADYAGNTTPTVNDYLVVQDASDYTGDILEGTWRFKYTGTWSTDGKSGWNPEYQVNETPLTSAQLAALNSGITSGDVTLIGTALQPNDNISELTNDARYIVNKTSATNAISILGSTSTAGISIGPSSSAVVGSVSIGNSATTNYGNNVAIGNSAQATGNNSNAIGYNAKATANTAIQIGNGTNSTASTLQVGFGTTNTNWQLLNGSTGLIPDARLSSNIARTSAIPTVPTNISAFTNDSEYITSSALTDYVTTNTDQNITGTKTYVGQKKIGFKQSSSSDKLGFTLYNNSGTEKGYLEYNPSNTVDSVPLMTLGNYATASGGLTHVGFRKYSSISGASGAYNLLTPLISDARTPFSLSTTYTNFYLPLGFTDGTITVKTAKSGLVDLSSILPDISTKQDTLVSGTNIKTINNTSLLGSGNISVLQNASTGTGSYIIGNNSSSSSYSVALGNNATINNNAMYQTAIGTSTKTYSSYQIALGYGAKMDNSTDDHIYQIGEGTVAVGNTKGLYIGFGTDSSDNALEYKLLDGTTGLIPDTRISSNIARTSQITTPTYDSTNERITW